MRTTKAIVLVAVLLVPSTLPVSAQAAELPDVESITAHAEQKVAEIQVKVDQQIADLEQAVEVAPVAATQQHIAAEPETMPEPKPAPTQEPAPDPAPEQSGGEVLSVDSTNYCLRGTMYNGEQVHHGAAAMLSADYIGTRWKVLTGPYAGNTYTVKDKIGHSSEFDIWVPSCEQARNYGRQQIKIQRVG